DGPDRIDPRFAGALRLRLHEAHHTLVVAHRVGVGHGADRGEPAGRRRHGAGRDGLEILLPRLTQMDVHVDQPRSHDLAAAIHHHGARRGAEVASDALDLALEQVHVGGLVDLPRRIDHPAAPDQDPAQWSSPFPAALAQSGEPPARRESTAIRTATPLVTWGRITLCGPSATSLSISTPRFMGPGCRITRSLGAFASRSVVTPNTRLYSRSEGMNPASIRSSWSRRTFRASAHWMASSTRGMIVTPSSCTFRGRRLAGPHTATSAPSLVSPQILLRATRLWSTSPTIATLSPAIRPNLSRRVSRSRRAWVGCSCLPSPALMTFDRMRWPRNCAAPDAPWRITTMSMRIASRFLAVSTSVSPFETEEPCAATFTVSALSRFSANSNEMRVRVDASKKRLTTVSPRSVGTFLILRSLISLNGSAVSRMSRICSGVSGSSASRSLPIAPPVMQRS